MPRRLQFSLRALMVATALVSAFFAGELDGRRRENDRLNRIRDIRDEIEIRRREYEGGPMPADVRREMRDLIDELKALGWT